MVWPILISLAVTPGVSAAAAGSASAMSAAAANQALFAYIVVSSPLLNPVADNLVRRPVASQARQPRRRAADDAGHAHRHEIHAGDEKDAVHRLRRRLG